MMMMIRYIELPKACLVGDGDVDDDDDDDDC